MCLWAIGRFSKGLKNEFELAMVNKPSVFELSIEVYILMFSNKSARLYTDGATQQDNKEDPIFDII